MNFIPKIEYTEINTGTPKTFTFGSPPEGDPLGEKFKTKAVSSRTTAGVKQTQFNYSLKRYKLEFLFQNEALKDSFEDFFLNHATRGGEFNYFIHSDEVDYETFDMVTTVLKFDRVIPSAVVGEFEYSFTFEIEKVV